MHQSIKISKCSDVKCIVVLKSGYGSANGWSRLLILNAILKMERKKTLCNFKQKKKL